MAKSVLTDVQQFSFTAGGKTVDFDAFVTEWGDIRRPRLVFHEYLKRDGAEAENMGRSPHETHLTVVYIGPNWRKSLLEFQSLVDANPIGTLIHPFYGQMAMACLGFDDARVRLEDGLDTVNVPVKFRESSLSRQPLTQEKVTKGPASFQAQSSAYASKLALATQIYATATVPVAKFTSDVAAFTSAAVATTMSTGGPDPTLATQLAQIATDGIAVRNAIRSDPSATDDVQVYSAIALMEQILDQCNQLNDSLAFVKPALQPWQVPAQTTVMAIAQAFYGRDAAARLAEILANNTAQIINPAVVPAGTLLMLAPATVTQ